MATSKESKTAKVASVTEEKATTVKKETKKPVKKVSAEKSVKAAEVIQETYFELDGNQFLVEEINNRVKEAYKAEGHYLSAIKSLKIYLNLAERRAYYVVNDKPENKFVEF